MSEPRDLKTDLDNWITLFDTPIGTVSDQQLFVLAHEIIPHVIERCLRGENFIKGLNIELAAERDRRAKAEAEVAYLSRLINLCDTCITRQDFPECCPDNIEFGDGLGMDNIIACVGYKRKEGEK